MKRHTLIGLLLCCAISACAAEKMDLDNRVRSLNAKFDALEHKPDKMVPPDVLRQAHAIVLLDRTKAGVVFAYQGGAGFRWPGIRSQAAGVQLRTSVPMKPASGLKSELSRISSSSC